MKLTLKTETLISLYLFQSHVHPQQHKVAKTLLAKILETNPLTPGKYNYFDCYILLPQFIHLGRQTMDRFKSFIAEKSSENFFQDIQPDIERSKVEERVIRNAGDPDKVKKGEAKKMKTLQDRIERETNTLFLIIHDEAHYG